MSDLLIVAALGVLVLGAVLFPLVAGQARYADAGDLEADLARYREAERAGTVCRRCRFPNPAGSAYCAECGRALGEPVD